MASEKVVIINKNNFEEEVLKSDKAVLVDFWAPWCGPCRAVGPIVDELADEYEGRAKISKLNVDDEGELAAKFRVMSIPTIMIFKNGEVVEKVIGARSKSELISLLDKHID
ncbi:thioredoxin [Acetivibrio clariflavus]|uniref:Thioredoxin n=1 Tax=Acetivibrio clariflavus (strain DSM 19732 / NBRC 101661 / EBR45) TaxID=720554 RepID=G8LV46_ACECE|nr:thioredoxin [Acetivibrio clariflavus]AEV69623.1 thioredoxin [Acetivibrio clariflavus DSM 19732]